MHRITQEKIQEVADKIVKVYQPEKVILFGSYAWGMPTEDSDVDLFVIKETEDTRVLAREIDGFIFPRPFPMDIIVYKPEQIKRRQARGDCFIRDIFYKGKVLYAK